MTGRLRRTLLCGLAALSLPAVARAEDGWRASHSVDAVTDAVRDGAVYETGGDQFLVACTQNKTGPCRFWIAVRTDAHLGRRSVRNLTYRVGDESPTTSRWDYTPREAAPSWPLEDRHLVQRLLNGKADRLVLRLELHDGGSHDVLVPIDDKARELMSVTLATCQKPHA